MTNEEFVREAYAITEVKDLAGWASCFNPDGVFVVLGNLEGALRRPASV